MPEEFKVDYDDRYLFKELIQIFHPYGIYSLIIQMATNIISLLRLRVAAMAEQGGIKSN